MKKFLLPAVSLLLVLGSCQNDLEESVLSNGQKVVTASIEKQNSRLAVSYDETSNVFSLAWNSGDAFKVFSENNEPTTYNWSSGESFTQEGDDPVNPKYAIYPAANVTSVSGDVVTMNLSATPDVANINLPMWAGSPTDGNYAFKHLAAGLQFTLNAIPAGYNSLIVEADKPISGTFTATLTGNNPVLASTSTAEADKKVTVSFTAATGQETKNQVFYIPLPDNTYTTLKVSVSDGQTSKELKSWTNLTVARGKMYYTTSVVDATSVDAANSILAGIGEVPTKVNLTASIIASEGALDIPDAARDVTMDFGVKPTTSETSPLKFNQNEDEESGESTGVLNINMPAGADNLYAEINTPTTTTTLNGGSYKIVTAKTATNTLIVKSGTTIEKLILNGGNVRIEGGTVTSIYDADGNEYTLVTTLDALKTAITGNKNIILGAEITSTEIITINRALTLNGNGYTLTSTAGRAINIETEGSVTIKNLTVEASGERAFNVINKPAQLTLDNVKATAKNYAVMIATSAGAANLTIENSDLTGLAVINVAGAGANVEISNTKITNVDANDNENYGAITVWSTAENSTVKVDESSIIEVADDSRKASVFPGTATITGVDDIGYIYATIGAAGFESLAEAIEYAKAENTIVLVRDITLVESLTIPAEKNVTFDLNGHSITAPDTDVFEVVGTLTINDENNEGVVTAGSSRPASSVSAVWANGGTVTINGGHYKVHADQAGKRNDCIYAGHNADNENTAGNITINGGKFEYVWPEGEKNYTTDYNGDQFLLNCANSDDSDTKITVNGGEFMNHVPGYEDVTPPGRTDKEVVLGDGKAVYSEYGKVETYHSVDSDDVWYKVTDVSGGNTEYIPV